MTWTIGMGEVENVGRQCSESRSALISEIGAKLIYVGNVGESRLFGPEEIFDYQDEYVRNFSLFASKLNENGVPADIWLVAFRESFIVPLTKDDGAYYMGGFVVKRKAPRWNGIVTSGMIASMKANIKSALLSHPTWPSDYGRPDVPARSVEFIPEVRRRQRL